MSSSSVVCVTRQIGHYHHARFAAASNIIPNFSVLNIGIGADFPELLSKGEKEFTFETVYGTYDLYKAAIAQRRLSADVANKLNQSDPDVVVISGWAFPESFAAMLWAKSRNKRIIVMSESQRDDAARSSIRELIKRRIVGQFDAALVGGRTHVAYMRELGMPANKIQLGYDAVDNAYFSKNADAVRKNSSRWRRKLELPDRYLLASARFIQKKNLARLFEAFNRVSKTDPTIHLLILGGGSLEQELKKKIVDLGESRIVLKGFQSYGALPAFYALSQGLVHVSTSEQWGLVINEACAVGIPIIASYTCGATSELLIDGANGFVVDPFQVSSIEHGLQKLLSMSEQMRRSFGDQSRKIVADWGPDRFAQGLEECVSACLLDQRSIKTLSVLDRVLLKILIHREIDQVP